MRLSQNHRLRKGKNLLCHPPIFLIPQNTENKGNLFFLEINRKGICQLPNPIRIMRAIQNDKRRSAAKLHPACPTGIFQSIANCSFGNRKTVFVQHKAGLQNRKAIFKLIGAEQR